MAAIKQRQVSDVKLWYARAFFRCGGQRISGKLLDLLQRTQPRVNFAVLCGSGCNGLKLHGARYAAVAAKTTAFIGGVGSGEVTKPQ